MFTFKKNSRLAQVYAVTVELQSSSSYLTCSFPEFGLSFPLFLKGPRVSFAYGLVTSVRQV